MQQARVGQRVARPAAAGMSICRISNWEDVGTTRWIGPLAACGYLLISPAVPLTLVRVSLQRAMTVSSTVEAG